MIISNEHTKNKYRNISLCGSSVAANRKITSHFIEVSTLGFISSCLDFTEAVKIASMPDSIKHKIVASVVKSSFGIYIAIETLLPWTLPKTLLYPSSVLDG